MVCLSVCVQIPLPCPLCPAAGVGLTDRDVEQHLTTKADKNKYRKAVLDKMVRGPQHQDHFIPCAVSSHVYEVSGGLCARCLITSGTHLFICTHGVQLLRWRPWRA